MTKNDARSDPELLSAIADGDRVAFQELYRRHGPWLTLRLTRRCAQADVVDQAVQDTFLAVWRKPQSYSGSGEVGAWLWGIGVRRLIDQLRRTRKPILASREEIVVSAEDRVLEGTEHGDLAGAMQRLSPELRAVVQATVLDGLTTREASRLLGIPTGTVKTRMSRARTQLRESLA